MQALSQDYEAAFKALLIHVAERGRRSPKKYTAFWPVICDEFQLGSGLMVVGQAPDGWGDNYLLAELRKNGVEGLMESARASSESTAHHASAQEWLTGPSNYNWRKSPFWRLIEAFVIRNGLGGKEDWPRHLAYTNLYKVPPWTGNPSPSAQDWQRNGCVGLFQRELQELRPGCALILTGKSWFDPFVKGLGLETPPKGRHVYGAVTWGPSRLILAEHPRPRKGHPGPREEFVTDLSAVFAETGRTGNDALS